MEDKYRKNEGWSDYMTDSILQDAKAPRFVERARTRFWDVVLVIGFGCLIGLAVASLMVWGL